MSCSIIVIDSFRRDAKRLLKKYISLKTELEILQQQLLENPRFGTLIHENVYKIRLAVKSKGKGKSGGMRVITHVIDVEIQIEENTTEQSTSIYLVAIYDKSEMENIPESDLKALIAEIQEELDEEEAG
jgi:mRNA-degrading endonuclease RelE of RelBE toxin-antitoxin system